MLDLPAVEIAGKLAGPVFLGAGHKHLAKRLVGAADQRYQAGPTPGVEFAHHIVDQQDRRRAVDAGEVVALRHFQRDGKGALLTLAGVLRRRLAVERQLEFVPVRADQCRAVSLLANPRLRQVHREILPDAWRVGDARVLRLGRDFSVAQADEWREFFDEVTPGGDELFAVGDELAGEAVEQRQVGGVAPEQRVARSQRPGVAVKQSEIAGLRLREQQVEKTAARLGRPVDQQRIFGAEDHGAQCAEVIGDAADRLFVDGEFALGRRPVMADFALRLAKRQSAGEEGFLPVADDLRVACAPE